MEYDYLNHLTQAKHVAADDGGAKILGQYSEKITYADARGNIAAIKRYGVIPGASYPSGMIDDLSFTIKPGSNQMQRVADAAPQNSHRAVSNLPLELRTSTIPTTL